MRFVLKILAGKPNYLTVLAQLTRYNSIVANERDRRGRTLLSLAILTTISIREAVRDNDCSSRIHDRNFGNFYCRNERRLSVSLSDFFFFPFCARGQSQVFSMRLITMEW